MKKTFYYFIAVNYGTSHLIANWKNSIKKNTPEGCSTSFIIVDNYHSDHERKKTQEITKKNKIKLIKNKNTGYGSALNKGIRYCLTQNQGVVLAGNLDIDFLAIPEKLPNGRNAYIPEIYEGERNRNPFLTYIQRKALFLFIPASKTGNTTLFMGAVFINKLLGFLPSQTWAVHGSLFCINIEAINSGTIFNEKSFLYAEELEFASYLKKNKIQLIKAKIIAKHDAHAATSKIGTTKSLSRFMQYWCPAFKNWRLRWS